MITLSTRDRRSAKVSKVSIGGGYCLLTDGRQELSGKVPLAPKSPHLTPRTACALIVNGLYPPIVVLVVAQRLFGSVVSVRSDVDLWIAQVCFGTDFKLVFLGPFNICPGKAGQERKINLWIW